jgi:hypothetical protein
VEVHGLEALLDDPEVRAADLGPLVEQPHNRRELLARHGARRPPVAIAYRLRVNEGRRREHGSARGPGRCNSLVALAPERATAAVVLRHLGDPKAASRTRQGLADHGVIVELAREAAMRLDDLGVLGHAAVWNSLGSRATTRSTTPSLTSLSFTPRPFAGGTTGLPGRPHERRRDAARD